MSDNTLPTQTPNVVVHNPAVRKVAGVVLGSLALIVPTVITVDAASDAFDVSAYTTPAMAGLLFLSGLFGLAVTTPNVPTR